jgi:hypothetical protein
MLERDDLDRICPLPPDPDALPRVLTRRQALDRGITRRAIARRVDRGRWRRVLPRTYLTVDTFTERDRLDAALLFAGPGAALSGAAALRASGVPRVALPDRVLVLVPPGNRTESRSWVQVRRTFRPCTTVQWLGPRRVEVARAIADLALTMRRLDDVRALVARVVQARHCTVEELGVELAAGPRQGSAFLRQALREVGQGAESAPEARASRILRRAGITGFVQNAQITLPDGSVRRLDFYWAELRAALEIDSLEWHFGAAEWAATWDRHLQLASAGIAAIHRPPSALADPARFATEVRAWLAARKAELRAGLR